MERVWRIAGSAPGEPSALASSVSDSTSLGMVESFPLGLISSAEVETASSSFLASTAAFYE